MYSTLHHNAPELSVYNFCYTYNNIDKSFYMYRKKNPYLNKMLIVNNNKQLNKKLDAGGQLARIMLWNHAR